MPKNERAQVKVSGSRGPTQVIMICGPSGCGKSTLALALAATLPSCCIVKQDDAFTRPFLAVEARDDDSYESPVHIAWKRLETRVDHELVHFDVVIVEGHLVATNARLVAKSTLYVVIKAPPALCKARRLDRRERSVEERGHLARYIDLWVTPSHLVYGAPALAHLVAAARGGRPLVEIDAADGRSTSEYVAQVTAELLRSDSDGRGEGGTELALVKPVRDPALEPPHKPGYTFCHFAVTETRERENCLLRAVSTRNVNEVQNLLFTEAAPVDPNCVEGTEEPSGIDVLAGAFPLAIAAQRGWDGGDDEARARSRIMMELLCDAGADVDMKNVGGYTALHESAMGGYVDGCRFLLERGADIEILTMGGGTPLFYAALKGKSSTTQFLLDAGANSAAKVDPSQMRARRDAGGEAVWANKTLHNRYLKSTKKTKDAATVAKRRGHDQMLGGQRNDFYAME